MISDSKYRAGVLIIGSLLWDNTQGRRPWREQVFGEQYHLHQIPIKVPIKYGRYSDKRQCPTMTFSTSYHLASKFGMGVFCPFKNQNLTKDEFMCQARLLSEAEGNTNRKMIKGGKRDPWCVLVYMVNPALKEDEAKWGDFNEKWKNEEKRPADISSLFKCACEEETIFSDEGELRFDWPEELTNYDLLLATQTRPTDCYSAKTLANLFYQKPEYFVKNRLQGISTHDDNKVIEQLKKMDLKQFRKNALENSCTELEIDKFLSD